MSKNESIYDLSAARAMALYAQHLTEPDHQNGELANKNAVYRAVKDLGCVQIDTLHVVQRSHYLILWSRLGGYDPADYDDLLYDPQDRRLFEGWRHSASIIPLEDYRYQIPHMHSVRQNPTKMSRDWLSEPFNQELLQSVYERIKVEGPLRARDFAYKGPQREGWWDWKPAKNALEYLFAWGELMIADRVNFQRLYDLSQRVLPEWVEVSEPTFETSHRFWLEQGVRALGICQPLQAADYSYRKRNAARGYLTKMLDEGIFIQVNVRISDGSVQPHIIHHQDQHLLEKAADGDIPLQRTTFLSPFDNLFWARGRDKQFWNFRNLLEAYKPAPTRIWGYFNMPILHHDQLVGRIDPKVDRKSKRLIIKSIYLEEGIELQDELVSELAQAFHSFLAFHQAKDLVFERSTQADLGEKILAQM
jgi:uncharacterized protein YcaQ